MGPNRNQVVHLCSCSLTSSPAGSRASCVHVKPRARGIWQRKNSPFLPCCLVSDHAMVPQQLLVLRVVHGHKNEHHFLNGLPTHTRTWRCALGWRSMFKDRWLQSPCEQSSWHGKAAHVLACVLSWSGPPCCCDLHCIGKSEREPPGAADGMHASVC